MPDPFRGYDAWLEKPYQDEQARQDAFADEVAEAQGPIAHDLWMDPLDSLAEAIADHETPQLQRLAELLRAWGMTPEHPQDKAAIGEAVTRVLDAWIDRASEARARRQVEDNYEENLRTQQWDPSDDDPEA